MKENVLRLVVRPQPEILTDARKRLLVFPFLVKIANRRLIKIGKIKYYEHNESDQYKKEPLPVDIRVEQPDNHDVDARTKRIFDVNIITF